MRFVVISKFHSNNDFVCKKNFQIDLDTIDVSNLNRQFLFHREHVGRSKAEVARESALAFNPKVSIKAYHDSITT